MENSQAEQQIIKEIDKFLAMTAEVDDDTLMKQFAYIKTKVDTGMSYKDESQRDANTKAYNLLDVYSYDDLRFFFPEKGDLTASILNRATALGRLQSKANQVKKLIHENFLSC